MDFWFKKEAHLKLEIHYARKKSLTFVMPYEMNFVLNFTIGEHHLPTGCGHLESHWWTDSKKKPDPVVSKKEDARLWIGSPGFEDQPPCGKNTYAPEGEATADIVRLFAEDHEAWQERFFNAWEKMQQNGYNMWELTAAPDNGRLLSQTEWHTYNGSDDGSDIPSSWDMPSSWELSPSGEERFDMPHRGPEQPKMPTVC